MEGGGEVVEGGYDFADVVGVVAGVVVFVVGVDAEGGSWVLSIWDLVGDLLGEVLLDAGEDFALHPIFFGFVVCADLESYEFNFI